MQTQLEAHRLPRKKYLIITVFGLGIVVLIILIVWWLVVSKPSNSTDEIEQTNQPQTVRLVAVGDNIPHETVDIQAKTDSGYNFVPFFSLVQPYLQNADVRFCNQEAPSAGEEFGISGYPTFNAPTQFATDLNTIGCNVINLANNHIADKGVDAINKTLDVWAGLNTLAVAGVNKDETQQNQVRFFEKNGIKFAFVAFTDSSNNTNIPSYALNMMTPELVTKLIKEADANADIVIVSAHWGTEDSTTISSAQETMAQTMADNGADIILGTGPHVLQPVQRLVSATGRQTIVWYSLGNFLSSQLTIDQLIGGLAIMDIVKQANHVQITTTKFLPTYMHYEWSPAEKAAEDLLKRKNLKIYPLDQAADALSKSLFNTSIEAQTNSVRTTLNKYTPIEIVTSSSL